MLVLDYVHNGHVTATAAIAATAARDGLELGRCSGITYFVVVVRVILTEEALLLKLGATRNEVPVRLAGAGIVDLLRVEGLQKERLAHADGGLLHVLPLFADTLGEQKVLQGEAEEYVFEEVEVCEHSGGRGGCHLVGVQGGEESESGW